MNTSPFGSLVTAMVSPFASNGMLDLDRARQLAQHLVENASTGLVVAGTTGESPTLSHDEKLQLFRAVKEAVRVPVIANVGSNNTQSSVEMARESAEIGVDALLAVVPYYNKPSQEGLYQHFKAIANATPLPVVLYNLPGRTSRNMEAATTARLSEIPNIIGTKESSGDPTQWARTKMLAKTDFLLMSGNDSDTLPMLALGAVGVVSVISHIAGQQMKQMVDAFWSGDLKTALEIHCRLLPVVDALFPPSSSNPIPLKAALKLQGFDCGGLRLPLVDATKSEIETVRTAMTNAGLL